LLTDTALPITQVAQASGFESLRRFNAAFLEHYRFNPTQLRREGTPGRPRADTPLRLAYRPPYDISAMLDFFTRRELRGVEQVDGMALRRTVGWTQKGQPITGWLEARFVPEKNEVHVTASSSLSPMLGAVLQRVRQGLDLNADPAQIDPVLVGVPLPPRPGLRLPGSMDGFETGVRVILGQQVTVKAARTLVQRLVERFGQPIDTPFAALTHVFPSAATLAQADPEVIGKLGIVRQRVKALQALAQAVHQGDIVLHPGAPLDTTMDALRELPGVGEWTAQVIAMRALSWPDAWPASDVALMNVLGTRDMKQIHALAEPWRPWRAYAVMRLWHHLENPL
jgi:AraC family transcriptional regulator, regulatory protein of adaptative response / DNA-3-methyladenine glycosylase II